ncbi:MAG: helix-turn-helix transcriptional regulator [Acetivibrio sp.]
MKKLYPQVTAIGQIYRVITDVCPQAKTPHPEIYPMLTYTKAILCLQQNRKSTPGIEKTISELSDEIDIDDWEKMFYIAIPLELQGSFYSGYYKGANKTKLAAMRKSKGMTQAELAKITEVTQKDISRWETAEITPGVESLKKLSEALDCSVDDII